MKMDDKRLEDTLRESWRPELPDGMRERVLRAARQGLLSANRPRLRIPRWKPLLAGIAIVIVLSTSIANHQVEVRLAALTDGHPTTSITAPADGGFLRHRREIARMLALTPADARGAEQSKGDDTL